MASSIFQFKKFNVQSVGAAHPVGTDSVLLGAWAEPMPNGAILDIGTSTGICALMMAQKTQNNKILGIDLDKESAYCAAKNFEISPWSDRLAVQHISIQKFVCCENLSKFSTILCNPPFFKETIKAKDARRLNARHQSALPFIDLIRAVKNLLSEEGRFTVILPYSTGQYFKQLAAQNGLYFSKETNVQSIKGKPYERSLLEFRKKAVFFFKNDLVLMSAHKKYSDAYWAICQDFYLKQHMGTEF